MIFSNLFKKKYNNWENNRHYLKSATDLKLLPEQIIYVEKIYSHKANKFIRNQHNEIAAKLKSSMLSADFIYLPIIAEQLQTPTALFPFLTYYFPNINQEIVWANTAEAFKTEIISSLFFSALDYKNDIKPGFFRYVGKEENLFIYEYFLLETSNKHLLLEQIDYYINSLTKSELCVQAAIEEENVLFDEEFNEEIFTDNEPICERVYEQSFASYAIEDYFDDSEKETSCKIVKQKEECVKKQLRHKKIALPEDFFEERCNLEVAELKQEKSVENTNLSKEHDLISQIKSDIQNLKNLGFYEILLKEIGGILFENKTTKLFQPSGLVIDEDFRIFLSDFNNMEIVMTPLPKSLFILFLRHPKGINLKSLIEYKRELLEIYKLLSYRETYFNMVESVNRICNPFEGSINEKLSRIKEAFLKQISIDTAKHYIIVGERGEAKKIEIDRSLITLPKAFQEIELTKIKEL